MKSKPGEAIELLEWVPRLRLSHAIFTGEDARSLSTRTPWLTLSDGRRMLISN